VIILIFRHGHAESKSESPDKTDEGRRLTQEGRDQVKWTCAKAKEFGVVPTVVVSSPRARGQESAEMTRRALNPKAKLITDTCLEPEADVRVVYKFLSKLRKDDSVVLVMHLPLLGYLFADILNWEAVWQNLDFENGAMARIDTKGLPKSKSGNLIWLISPARLV
jgi:phosphohistidine phosphatase SixA